MKRDLAFVSGLTGAWGLDIVYTKPTDLIFFGIVMVIVSLALYIASGERV